MERQNVLELLASQEFAPQYYKTKPPFLEEFFKPETKRLALPKISPAPTIVTARNAMAQTPSADTGWERFRQVTRINQLW